MLFRFRLPVIMAGLAVLAIAFYASVDWLRDGQNRQESADKMPQPTLAIRENSVDYQLLPESILIGLCWREADGSRHGVFKDITGGVMQWREMAPDLSSYKVTLSSSSPVGILPDKQQLLRQLKQLSFQPADFVLTGRTAKISGVLTVAKHSRHIILDLDRPDDRDFAHKDTIEVTTSTAIDRYLPVQDLYAQQYNIDLCLNMQAASTNTASVLALDLP